jgi:hypothetical protein
MWQELQRVIGVCLVDAFTENGHDYEQVEDHIAKPYMRVKGLITRSGNHSSVKAEAILECIKFFCLL